MKVALVYDRVNKIGGAERVLEVLHEIWPNAPLYTSIYKKEKAHWANKFKIITSFLQKLKFIPHEFLPNLMGKAFKSFDLGQYDMVISISSAEGKYLQIKNPTKHISYCLTPTRYLWSGYFDYLKTPGFGFFNKIIKVWFVMMAPLMRMRDFEEVQKIHNFIAISKEVQSRILKYYRRKSIVIYPPVFFSDKDIYPTKNFKQSKAYTFTNNYYLIVSRLVPYKQIDLAIHVFNKLQDKNLIIVGTGSDEVRLKKMSKNNIIFTGEINDNELIKYYFNCLALIFTGIEDFGLTSLEAQNFKKPVFCRNLGGCQETVLPGKTGELFCNEKELEKLIINFDKNKYYKQYFEENLLRFSKEKFKRDFSDRIEKLWKTAK